jgi:ABC-2 type transport system permease protein
VLLRTSGATRVLNAPLMVSLEMAQMQPDRRDFSLANQMVAVMLEGEFNSAFANRLISGIIGREDNSFRETGETTRMLIVADGDIIRNDVSVSGGVPEPLPLGYDRYSRQTYGNQEFVMNALNYLVDETGLMELRTRELQLRLLDRARVREQKRTWQLINMTVPLLVVMVIGLMYNQIRKRYFAKI